MDLPGVAPLSLVVTRRPRQRVGTGASPPRRVTTTAADGPAKMEARLVLGDVDRVDVLNRRCPLAATDFAASISSGSGRVSARRSRRYARHRRQAKTTPSRVKVGIALHLAAAASGASGCIISNGERAARRDPRPDDEPSSSSTSCSSPQPRSRSRLVTREKPGSADPPGGARSVAEERSYHILSAPRQRRRPRLLAASPTCSPMSLRHGAAIAC